MIDAIDDPDGPLVRRAGQGDHAACRALVDLYLPRLHRFAFRLTGNAADADEVAQETFERLWRHAPSWRPGAAKFSTWMFRVARNLCTDRLRQRRPEGPDTLETLVDDQISAQVALERASTADEVRHAVAALPDRQREALVLCHFEGLSNIEAAAVMETSIEALESLLARARRTLRSGLASLASAENLT